MYDCNVDGDSNMDLVDEFCYLLDIGYCGWRLVMHQ